MLPVYTIFDHPKDFPNHFVVRQSFVDNGMIIIGGCQLADTLEEARALVPKGLVKIGRNIVDEPAIVESWV